MFLIDPEVFDVVSDKSLHARRFIGDGLFREIVGTVVFTVDNIVKLRVYMWVGFAGIRVGLMVITGGRNGDSRIC